MLLRYFSFALLLVFGFAADTSQTSIATQTDTTSRDTVPATTTTSASSRTYSQANPDQYKSWKAELKQLLTEIKIPALFPSPTRSLNISMPQSLRGPIMTALPASVILNLIGEKYRVSVQKQFAAKDYPDWYKTMDSKPKEFFENFASSLKAGETQVFVTETDKEGPTKTDSAAEETSTDSSATNVLDKSVLYVVLGFAGLTSLMVTL